MTEKEKMLKGLEYDASDSGLREVFHRAKDILKEFNATGTKETEKRQECLKKLFGGIGSNLYIEPPFYCDYGENIFFGNNVYMNVNCVVLDCAKITVGNNVMFGPGVQIYAASHPLKASERIVNGKIIDTSSPIRIGDDVWIGGNAIVLPGVTIGDNVVIGSGSVVTKDIPSGSLAVGSPCKVIKKL